jgi:two-component system, response regulator YesN
MTTKLRESGARVLVVDDCEEMRSALRRMLASIASEICEARNGVELMAAVAGDVPFDLIVTDVRMPWMNGLGAATTIRRAGIDTPLILITGFSDAETGRRIQTLPRASLLRKPFTREELLAAARDLAVVPLPAAS